MSEDTTRESWIEGVLAAHERSLVTYAARLTGNRETGRDVAQETFLRLCRQERGEVEPHLVEWLFTVCRHRALDVRAKERPMTTIGTTIGTTIETTTERGAREPLDPGPDPAREAARGEEGLRLRDLVGALPDNQREVIELRFRHGLSYAEISGVTESPIGQVSWLVHRAMRTLRERMAADMRQEQAEGMA